MGCTKRSKAWPAPIWKALYGHTSLGPARQHYATTSAESNVTVTARQ